MRANSLKYAKLLNDLKLEITGGELREGDFIPSENKLAEQFGLSRPTVRKAISELAEEGLVRTIPGKGSVVLGTEHLELKVTVLNLFWVLPSNEFPIIQMVVERFNKEHRHIQIRLVPFNQGSIPSMYAAYRSVFMQDYKPDLLCLTNRFLLELKSEKMESILQPLGGLDLATKHEVYPFLWSSGKQDGELFAIPITFSPVMLVYNKSMFDEVGIAYPDGSWTRDDFVQAAAKLTRFESDTGRYGFAFSPSFYRWPLFFMQEGGRFVHDGHSFPPPAQGSDGIRFILDLIYKHRVSPLIYRSSDLSEQFFHRGKVGMILSTYYLCDTYANNEFEWGICKFPSGTLDMSLAISTNIGISKECRHVPEAETFIRYLLSEPVQAYFKNNGSTIPALKTVAESAKFPHSSFSGSGYYSFLETLNDIRLVNDLGLSHPEMSRLSQAMEMVWFRTDSFEQVWNGLGKSGHEPKSTPDIF